MNPGRPRLFALAGVVALGALAALPACTRLATNLGGAPGPEAGLLRATMPSRSSGATHLDRLTDGIAAQPGDTWQTDVTSVLASPAASVTFDLGRAVTVRCAMIQADGDDRYTLALSDDGQRWRLLWTAAPADDHGQQLRLGRALDGTGRYLRLAGEGGDGHYAVAEVGVWSTCPARLPPPLALQRGTPLAETVHGKLWLFVALAAAYVLGYRRRAPDFIKLLVVLPAGVAVSLALQLRELWPLSAALALEAVGALAAVAAAAVLRRVIGRAVGDGAGSPRAGRDVRR